MDMGWFVMKDSARRYARVEDRLERLERRSEGRVPIQCSQTFVKRTFGELVRFLERYPMSLPLVPLAMVLGFALLALR